MPPGVGICHQVNLEFLAQGVLEKDGLLYPDTLVGTDSHTTMVNGLGVVGWGVGGIEAEAAMLGQPAYFLTPDVVGVHLSGALREGVTATDLVLAVTELLRKAKVVGKFVEFHGEGARSLCRHRRGPPSPTWRPSTAPPWASSPPTSRRCATCEATGRTRRARWPRCAPTSRPRASSASRAPGSCDYSAGHRPRPRLGAAVGGRPQAAAGPGRALPAEERFAGLLSATDGPASGARRASAAAREAPRPPRELGVKPGGGSRSGHVPTARTVRDTNPATELEMMNNRPTPAASQAASRAQPRGDGLELGHGDVVIAAITTCTNTSNPGGDAGGRACWRRKAVERGLAVAALR